MAGWDALRGAIEGEVVLPDSASYDRVRTPPMARFRDVCPAVVVRCHTPADVAEALAFAHASSLEVAVRSGGHCFAGGSSTRGMLLDVGPMDGVSLAGEVATVGAGARLGDIYDALAGSGRTIAGGCGPTVGIAGLALGGGLGILGRTYGLTSDQLVGAEVVLADGRVVRCDEQEHPDLFWALRGAGGTRFGVLTSLELAAVPTVETTAFELRWPEGAMAAIVDAWQVWAPDADDGVAASLLVTTPADPGRPVDVRVFGAMVGSESDARSTLDGMVARAGIDPISETFERLPYRQAKRYLAEHDAGSTAKPNPGYLFAKSEFFRAPVAARSTAALAEHIRAARVPGQARELDFTPWGGAYNRVRPDATAFPHRTARFLLKHEVVIDAEAAQTATTGARDWLARSWALAHPSGTGGAYANFPDSDLGAWDPAYHGANLDRLLSVKARYDPDDAFAHRMPSRAPHRER
jgi:FAD/FMN-containing dehydrogenase